MSDNNALGCSVVFVVIARIAAFIGPGFLAWDWIEPDSFGSAILFLLLWSILGFVAQLLVFGIAVLLAKANNEI